VSAKPRLLDLFSGAGGCTKGYQLAGFHVTGVDNRPQPRYVGDAFILGDALEYCAEHGHEYDAIHASPPCKAHTALQNLREIRAIGHQSLIAPTRALLKQTGRPWVLENVPGAPPIASVQLCGSAVGLLMLRRHRLFESPLFLLVPRCQHDLYQARFPPNRGDRKRNARWGSAARVVIVAGHDTRGPGGIANWREAMGIDWMTRDELAQAIPPAYCEFIGRQLLNYV
jgi:hypothetical protein